MAAYISWKLKHDNYSISKRLATKIPVMVQSVYQYVGNNDGRGRFLSVAQPTFSLFNNKVRRDHLYATAGANFGFHLAKTNEPVSDPIDFNQLFFDYFKSTENVKDLPPYPTFLIEKPWTEGIMHYRKVIKPYFLLNNL